MASVSIIVAMFLAGESPPFIDSLKGEWQVESVISSGMKESVAAVKGVSFTFREGDIVPSEDPKVSLGMKIDETMSPIAIDVTFPDEKRPALGIVQIEGDRLKWCLAEIGTARPTKFDSPKGSRYIYYVLKRKKKD